MDVQLCGTQITGSYLSGIFKRSFGPDAILQSVDAQRIGVSQGFASSMLRLKLTWADGKKTMDLPETVVAKIPSDYAIKKFLNDGSKNSDDGDQMKDFAQFMQYVHLRECNFYNTIGSDRPIAMPICYANVPITDQEHGLLILEDLSQRAAICSSLDGLTLGQVISATTEIARLQAWSLTTTIDWRGSNFFEENETVTRGILKLVSAELEKSIATFPTVFGHIDLEKMKKLLEYDPYVEVMTEHRSIMDDVLAHSDFYKNNILFETDGAGGLTDKVAAIVDFQAVTKGTPVQDLVRLLCCSVNRHIRREHGPDILRHYFHVVTSIAGDKFKATFGDIFRLYVRQMALDSIVAVAWSSNMVANNVKSEGAQKIKEEEEYLKNIRAVYDDSISALI